MESKKLTYNFGFTIISRGSLLLITLLLTRVLGESIYGYIAYFRSMSQIAEAGLGIAIGIAVGRIITSKYTASEVNNRVLSNLLFFILSMLAFTVILSFYLLSDENLSVFITYDIYISFIFFLIFNSVLQLYVFYFKSVERYKELFKFSVISSISNFTLIYFFISFFGIHGAFYGLATISVMNLVIFFIVIKSGYFNLDLANFNVSKVELKHNSIPLVLSSLLSPIGVWLVSSIIISDMNSGVEKLSFFNVSFLLFGLMMFVPMVISEVAFPKLNNNYNNLAFIRLYIFKISSLLILISLLIKFFVFLFGSFFSLLFFDGESDVFLRYLNDFSTAFIFSCSLPLLGKFFIVIERSYFNLAFNVLWFLSIFVIYYLFNSNVDFPTVYICSYFLLFIFQWSVFLFKTKEVK